MNLKKRVDDVGKQKNDGEFLIGSGGLLDAKGLAHQFHETYERLAPQFGYETKEETRQFQEDTPNGRLMIAVCSELLASNDAMSLQGSQKG